MTDVYPTPERETPMSIETTVRTITPAEAKTILDSNPKNRPVRNMHVEALAEDMRQGRWTVTGEAIKFNGDGSLLDGQHRLHACVRAATPFQTVIVTGVDHAAQINMDTGAQRSFADYLRMHHGLTDCNRVSAMVLGTFCFQASNGSSVQKAGNRKPTRQELDSWYRQHAADIAWMRPLTWAVSTSPARIPTGIISVVMLGASLGQMKLEAEAFADAVATGTGQPKDPALVLREHLIRSNLSSSSNMSTAYKMRLVVKAWNRFVCGEEVALLKLTSSELKGRSAVRDAAGEQVFPT